MTNQEQLYTGPSQYFDVNQFIDALDNLASDESLNETDCQNLDYSTITH